MKYYMINGYIVGDRTLEKFIDDIERYSEPVRKMLWDKLCLEFDSLDEQLTGIKSPIEQALFLALRQIKGWVEEKIYVEAVALEPQYQVKTKTKTYYLDFLLGVLLKDNTQILLAIECDGHDFHEKTKEQARKDRQRERDLTANGYTVIRFTGSEIYEDPYKCAYEIFSLINKKVSIRQFKETDK